MSFGGLNIHKGAILWKNWKGFHIFAAVGSLGPVSSEIELNVKEE